MSLKKALGYSCYQSANESSISLSPWLPHVDYVIAIDGKYKTPMSPAMYKMNLPNYSTDNTEEILKQLCGDKLVYEQFYGTQIDKRQRYFDIAGELGCDLLIVWDSDDRIHPDYQDWDLFNIQLDCVIKYWKEELFKMHCWLPDEKLWTKQHNATPDNIWKTYTRIHRYPGQQRYAKTHWTWSSKDVTNDQINEWEWKYPGADMAENPFLLKDGPVIDGVRFTTNRLLRTQTDLEWGDGWAFQNMHWESYHFNTEPKMEKLKVKIMFDHLKETKFPDLQYYFVPKDNGELGILVAYHLVKGEYIIINADGSESTLEEFQKK